MIVTWTTVSSPCRIILRIVRTLVAARRELENWLFFYFEPRERMRAANPVKEVRHLGLMGEELAAFLNTMKSLDANRFKAVEKALHTLMPNFDGIEVDVSDLGEVELRLKEGGVAMPARVLSEGTLRMLGLLALTGVEEPPALIGIRRAGERRPPAPDPVDRGTAENTGDPQSDPAHHHNALADPSRSADRRLSLRSAPPGSSYPHRSLCHQLGAIGARP